MATVMIICTIALTVVFQPTAAFAKTITADGDANLDGKVTAADARLALRCAVELEEFTDEQIARCDFFGDKKITAGHARKILRIVVGLEETPKKEEFFWDGPVLTRTKGGKPWTIRAGNLL